MTFKIEVTQVVENEDGSATITFDMDDTAKQALLQHALLDIFKKAAQRTIDEQDHK